MPLKRCSNNGISGWKWGDQGKCYTGNDAKKKAIKQGLAEGDGKLEALSIDELDRLIGDREISIYDRISIAKFKKNKFKA